VARIQRFLNSTIFFALLSVIVLIAIPYGTVDPAMEALFESIVFAIGILWIVEGLLSGTWLTPEHKLLVPILVLIAYALLQIVPYGAEGGRVGWQAISFDPYGTRMAAIKLSAYALFFALLLRHTENRQRLQALTYCVIGVAVASALFGMIRQTTQVEAGFLLPRLMPGSGYAQFINQNHFAYLMEMAAGLMLGFILSKGIGVELKLVYVSFALLTSTALVLTNSRGGIISLVFQLLFSTVLTTLEVRGGRQKHKVTEGQRSKIASTVWGRSAIAACMIVLLLAVIVWVGGDSLANKVGERDEITAAGLTGRDHVRRKEIWSETWQVIKANPILGVGFGGYWVAIDQYHDASGTFKPYQAHNDYLDLLASGGLFGIAIVIWLVVAISKTVRERLLVNNSFRRAVCTGAIIGLSGVAIHSIVDFGLQITVNAVVFIALIVLATKNIEPKETAASIDNRAGGESA
jgi:O-antigen ligase